MTKPSVFTKCVANSYAGPSERIVEFCDRSTQLGGLIAFRRTDAGLTVDVYRCGPGVRVLSAADNGAPEMLQALKDVSQAYQDMFDAMPVAWQTFDGIVTRAIAKAEGRHA